MRAFRELLCDTGLCLLLIAIACLGVWDERSNKPDRTP